MLHTHLGEDCNQLGKRPREEPPIMAVHEPTPMQKKVWELGSHATEEACTGPKLVETWIRRHWRGQDSFGEAS